MNMFNGISINLKGPICNCSKENLSWSIEENEDYNPELSIICGTCDIRLEVPYEQFTATFVLENEYPDGLGYQSARILQLVPSRDIEED